MHRRQAKACRASAVKTTDKAASSLRLYTMPEAERLADKTVIQGHSLVVDELELCYSDVSPSFYTQGRVI